MSNRTASLLLLLLSVTFVRAQELHLVDHDGNSQSWPLSELTSITFEDDPIRSANDMLLLHRPADVLGIDLSGIDSLSFPDGEWLRIHSPEAETDYALAGIDSLGFGDSEAVQVIYRESSAWVINPLESLGVTVSFDGAHVLVTSDEGIEDVLYELSGHTQDGGFKIYSEEDFGLRLKGVQLQSEIGPAINVQNGDAEIELAAGTVSRLADGMVYNDPPDDEDQKGAIFGEDDLVFGGEGAVVITGRGDDQHALACDDWILIQSGTITVAGATKDAVHTNDGLEMTGGILELSADGDGLDGGAGPVVLSGGMLAIEVPENDNDGIKCDGEITLDGAEVTLQVDGDQSKGMNAATIQLLDGTLVIQTTGDAVLEEAGSGFDPSYCTGIKADELVTLDGANVEITTSGAAGRGISSDGDISLLSGSLQINSSEDGFSYTNEEGQNDAAQGHCLKTDGDLLFSGGTTTLSHAGDGGRGISVDGNLLVENEGTMLDITTTGGSISLGGGNAAEAKAVKADSLITIIGGTLTIDSADDALKSETGIHISGGEITIEDSEEGIEAPDIHITGGDIFARSGDDVLNATAGVDGEFNDGSLLLIEGGRVVLDSYGGDCIDSNGNFTMAGGTLLVHGPPNQPEVALDINGVFRVDGGLLVSAAVNGNHTETPSNQSTAQVFLLRRNQSLSGGTLLHIEDSEGNELVTFAPLRSYGAIHFSSPDIQAGTQYIFYTGGSHSGSEQDGLYTGGSYTPGTQRATFTANGGVQQINF